VSEVLGSTKASKLHLVGHSRAGNTIRNFVKNGGGLAHVASAVLSAGAGHGARGLDSELAICEFHARGAYITQLNDGPTEATPGVRWLTLRSDTNDWFFQPTRIRDGKPDEPSGLRYDGPELTGATNIVLPGLDHKAVLTHPSAFREMFKFLVGREPERLDFLEEPEPVLNGTVTGMDGALATNRPLAGATVEIWEVDPATAERKGAPVHRQTTGADGLWGPFRAKADTHYEMVHGAAGYPLTHTYWQPFPRSSSILHLRPHVLTDADKAAGSRIQLFRASGWIGLDDPVLIDGAPPPGRTRPPFLQPPALLPKGTPFRSVPVSFGNDRLTVKSWSIDEGHVVVAMIHN
jgi:hypothetical protein